MRRRHFLKAISAAAVTTKFSSVFGAEADMQSGTGILTPVIDCHIHPMSQKLHDLISPFASKQGSELVRFDGPAIIEHLDNIGAQRAYALSTAYLWGGRRPQETASPFVVKPGEYDNVQAENNFVAEQAVEFPGRIIPFMGINPIKPYALDELERCSGELKMRGLKLHFWNSGVNLREESHLKRIHPVFEYVASQDIPVMLHFYNGRVADFGPSDGQLLVDNVLADCPSLRICFAHFIGAGNYADVVGDTVDAFIQASAGHQSLNRDRWFLDLSAIFDRQARGHFAGVTDLQLKRLGHQIKTWGLNNVLWGSDNRKDYLATTLAMWPLSDDELSVVMNNDGKIFIDG
jgi:uncharacterized protein